MTLLKQRPRRLRRDARLRRLVGETELHISQLIQPLFVDETADAPSPIAAMPGIARHSLTSLSQEAAALTEQGIGAVLLFGIPKHKDLRASSAYAPDGIIQQAVRTLKELVPKLLVMTDVCLCEYMLHGHCGVVENGKILNDPSLELLAQVALSHAEAGADLVAPSDMMDGRVAVIRQALDQQGFTETPILSYAVKYASAFYGPFREAADSVPQFGNRKSYQMDPANRREALREVALDIEEGADLVMVKPALPYLDVISAVRAHCAVPVAAYQVSGEYAMLKAAAERGWLDEKAAVLESLTAIKRAGADLIVTYYAKEFAQWA